MSLNGSMTSHNGVSLTDGLTDNENDYIPMDWSTYSLPQQL